MFAHSSTLPHATSTGTDLNLAQGFYVLKKASKEKFEKFFSMVSMAYKFKPKSVPTAHKSKRQAFQPGFLSSLKKALKSGSYKAHVLRLDQPQVLGVYRRAFFDVFGLIIPGG